MCFIVWDLFAYMKRLINLKVCCKIFKGDGNPDDYYVLYKRS